jgi:hypothetical protein
MNCRIEKAYHKAKKVQVCDANEDPQSCSLPGQKNKNYLGSSVKLVETIKLQIHRFVKKRWNLIKLYRQYWKYKSRGL